MNIDTELMLMLYNNGDTLKEVSKRYKITHQAVYQRLKNHPNYKPRMVSQVQGKKFNPIDIKIFSYKKKLEHIYVEIKRIVFVNAWNEGASIKDLASIFKTTEGTISREINRLRKKGYDLPLRHHPSIKYIHPIK